MRAQSGVAGLNGRRVVLSPGRHSSPMEGACVVELASLIGREPFTDRPRCVCPVIAAFLRGWNDRAAYADRQRLLPYAQRIVGSRGGEDVTRERRELCLERAGVNLRRGPIARLLAALALRVRIAMLCGFTYALRRDEGAAELAARLLYGRRDVDGAFALLNTMLAMGAEPRGRPSWLSPDGDGGPASPRSASRPAPPLDAPHLRWRA